MAHALRIPYYRLAPQPFQTLQTPSHAVSRELLGARLIDLVFLRASQINGCAFCMDMHWRDLVRLGADPRHLNTVAGWRESPFFSDRERAALRWTEIVTDIARSDSGDDEFARLQQQFNDEEIAHLSFAIAAINAWNRISVSLRNPVPQGV